MLDEDGPAGTPTRPGDELRTLRVLRKLRAKKAENERELIQSDYKRRMRSAYTGLLRAVAERRRHLDYLRNTAEERYTKLIKSLGLRR